MPALGSRPLAKLEPADLDAFYRRLLTSGGSGGRPLAPGTVRRIHGILRRALNQGVKWGWLGINPATATTPPRVPASNVKPPSPEALGRVLRRAEVEWPDLDLDSATVSIERGIVDSPDGLVEKGTKTHSARRVSLDAKTAAAVAEHHERMMNRAAMCRLETSASTTSGTSSQRSC